MSYSSLSRRDLVKFGTLAAVGGSAALAFAGCAPKTEAAKATSSGSSASVEQSVTGPSFMVAPQPITDLASTEEFDVVVVGAGISGSAAAMAAAEKGARVVCLQKEDAPSSQGNMGASVDLSQTSAAGKEALVSYLIQLSDHRSNRSLLEAWADNSYEALDWFEAFVEKGGIKVNEDEPDANRVLNVHGYDVHLHANTYFKIGHDEVVKALEPVASGIGVDYRFSTPAVQLQTNESGEVTGVVAQAKDGTYQLFTASKGVILATGDYQCDDEMRDYYCPDLKNFPALQINRTGDGHKMGLWAGGHIAPVGHTKMVHDARVSRADAPYLLVDHKAQRIMCEGPMQGYLNNYVRDYVNQSEDPMQGCLYSIVDSKWQEQAAEWAQDDPSINVRTCLAYYEGNTFEEAAQAAAVDGYVLDASAIESTVARYNELCAAGSDDDFGKNPRFMRAIDTPPFAIIPHDFGYGLSALLGGLMINADNQVLSKDGQTPIGNLYAVGNCSGGFFGGSDYPMDVLGLSIGRAITSGYLAGRFVTQR